MDITYRLSAGALDSTLCTRGDLGGHPSMADALRALAAVTPYEADELVTVETDGDGWLVYASEEAAARDSDGSSALGSITEEED